MGEQILWLWGGGTTMPAVTIRNDIGPDELRRRAREHDGRVSARLIALANALEGMDRATAARPCRDGPADPARLGSPLQRAWDRRVVQPAAAGAFAEANIRHTDPKNR